MTEVEKRLGVETRRELQTSEKEVWGPLSSPGPTSLKLQSGILRDLVIVLSESISPIRWRGAAGRTDE